MNYKGYVLDELARYEEAIEYYRKTIEIDPKYVHAWNKIGYVFNQMRKCEETIRVH